MTSHGVISGLGGISGLMSCQNADPTRTPKAYEMRLICFDFGGQISSAWKVLGQGVRFEKNTLNQY